MSGSSWTSPSPLSALSSHFTLLMGQHRCLFLSLSLPLTFLSSCSLSSGYPSCLFFLSLLVFYSVLPCAFPKHTFNHVSHRFSFGGSYCKTNSKQLRTCKTVYYLVPVTFQLCHLPFLSRCLMSQHTKILAIPQTSSCLCTDPSLCLQSCFLDPLPAYSSRSSSKDNSVCLGGSVG